MIEITYHQEPYNYGNIGSQDYDIKTEIKLDKDITGNDAIIAFIRLLNIATYRITPQTIERLLEDIRCEYDDNERIL